jgi:D-alanyl-lipoteichoic acid acyltransferase DltB (MBOAT superfamily)
MLFNTFQFLIFYLVVLVVVFALPQRFRWIFLLAASTYFYMCWNPKYIVFLILLIVVDYFCGAKIAESQSRPVRQLLLGTSLFTNLGMLFVFKYFNFLSHTASALSGRAYPLLDLVLPIGISFHVFQSLAYTIDVYRGRQEPERHFGLFALFVMFFPQLVAGPIERPQNLLHQFRERKHFTYENFSAGGRLALWGLIKKVCIADLLSAPVNRIYANPATFSGPLLLVGTFFFGIQIYCDFSGYTDIARGVAKIMGYDLMLNFRQPYFARSIKEFWQRWHISLSTWFRDYLYYPLGGSRTQFWKVLRNLLIVFVVSGLWHGAAWTFVIWGALHGFYMVAGEVTRKGRARLVSALHLGESRLFQLVQIFITLNLVMLGWVFFRAKSLAAAWYIVRHMYIPARVTVFDLTYGLGLEQFQAGVAFVLILLLILVDYVIERRPHAIGRLWQARPLRWAAYVGAAYTLVFFGVWERIEFIYFQF